MKSFASLVARIAVGCAASVFAGAVCAQYIWLDDKGVKQYSDVPPPSSTPASRILKGVKVAKPNAETPAAPDAVDKNALPVADKTPMTTADRNADFQKRRAEQAEKDKKAAEQERLAAEKARNCDRARDYQRTLESGTRVTRTGQDGERNFMTDDERARELRDARNFTQECKS